MPVNRTRSACKLPSYARSKGFWLALYRRLPGFAAVSEWVYAFIAAHRTPHQLADAEKGRARFGRFDSTPPRHADDGLWVVKYAVKLTWAKIGLVEWPFPIRAKIAGRLAENRIANCFAGLGLEVGADAFLGVTDPDTICLALVDPPVPPENYIRE